MSIFDEPAKIKLMNEREGKFEQQRMRTNRDELIERMTRILPGDGIFEALPGFFLTRLTKPTESVQSIYQPALCFVVQGSKRALLGGEVYYYDPGHYLLFTVDLPVVFHVDEASEEKPYFGFRLNLDSALVSSVLMESGLETEKDDSQVKAIDVNAIDADLLGAVVRLVRLLDSPAEQKVLAPLVKREIIYRLLTGGQGARLTHLMAANGDALRISGAIGHLREHLDEPLNIEEIARGIGMSVSSFHHHFKSITALSPLQFQKQLRLQEARRLMLAEDLDAASAGFRVGYEDPSYFSREYKKQFGAPPQSDIVRLRSNLAQ